MKTILITGRNGFIGQALVPELKKGHTIVSVIRREKENIDYTGEKIVLQDLREISPEDVTRFAVDLIVHLAAQIRGKAQDIMRNNVESSRAIFQIAKALGVPVLFLSSTNVLFAHTLGAYAQSKRACEEILRQVDLKYFILRVPLVLGQASPSIQTVRKFYKRFSFLPLLGPQQGGVQPIHVTALVAFLIKCINEGNFTHATLNLVGQGVFHYRGIMEMALGSKKRVRFVVLPYRLSLMAAEFFERLGLASPISSEEIRSVNMDKILSPGKEEAVQFLENHEKSLFECD